MAKGNKNHQWWIKTPTKTEQKSNSFSEELQHLMYNTTLHCYRWLVNANISNWETFLWVLVHIAGAGGIVFVLVHAYHMYSTNPMVTTLYDTLYPINEVPFPGVAICNNNRISYNAAVTLSKQLTDKYKSRFNATYFLENVKLLGKLYDSEAVVESEAIAFQTYLDMFESNDTLNLSNITTLMKKLSPECSDMLLRCIWRGVELPCMIKKSMNEFRLTQYGYCCTFNYVRYDYGQALKGDSYFIEETGPDSGLILLVDGSVHDYHYPLFSFKGFIVQIFNPLEYPDVPSGGVSEKLVEVGTEAFIRIDSITFITNDESRRFAPETRSCLFSNERPETFGQNYKRSDCVVGCRIASIHSLCNCVPFFVPVIEKKNDFSNLQLAHKCTLQHSSCLTHYRAKWATFLLTLEKFPGLEKDIEDGLYCPQCLATCSETIYNVKSTALPLLVPPKNSNTILRNIVNVSDVAVIRIYHGQPETWLYKQAPAVQWFEIISNLGGICGVITGFSLISLVEIMYFIVRRIVIEVSNWYTKSTRRDETLKIMP